MLSFNFIPLMVSEKKIFKHFYENLPFLPHRQPIKFTDLGKSCMKRKRLLNKHFCKKNPNIPNETEKIVNFLFSHYKSMGTIRCHSNQSSYPTGIKNTTFVEANVLSMYAKFQLHIPLILWFLRRRFLSILTKIDPFCRGDNQSNSPIWTKVV